MLWYRPITGLWQGCGILCVCVSELDYSGFILHQVGLRTSFF